LDNQLDLKTGRLTAEQVDLILRTLPLDISFVDENDTIIYYSEKKRIFTRVPAVIGCKVQNCHPARSVEVVEKILKAFKSGEKDTAEFWLQIGGRFILSSI